ncbi:hypothetical protein BO79DRAFT_57930 [Aspergillus costaricaensis CBS 115574]|uniref:Uncharacterized protein n=1 Tax=Aspergillus costaricaensis CBS 115574 TaxID=1448317 RepID=A0ACD1I2A9_9EURO|nr:hypothetical protein BO79DRAFT_57930 [Aspergillus costaricaensis CBS 115574]RAK84492.1 hypothetical protein BO79DRAFT_57930 [Aspergillus costaricaensis CBS 115574]
MIMKLCRGALCRQRRSRGRGQRAKAVLRCHELLFLPFPLASPNPFLFASDLNISDKALVLRCSCCQIRLPVVVYCSGSGSGCPEL